MSYMRPLCPYEYIEGESEGDYIFHNGTNIEDYGGIKIETALDILFKQFSLIKENDIDKDIILYCLKRICNNLNIKIRDKPLSFEEWYKLYYEIHERHRKQKQNGKICPCGHIHESLSNGNKLKTYCVKGSQCNSDKCKDFVNSENHNQEKQKEDSAHQESGICGETPIPGIESDTLQSCTDESDSLILKKSCKNCHYYEPDFNGSEVCTHEVFEGCGQVVESLAEEGSCERYKPKEYESEICKCGHHTNDHSHPYPVNLENNDLECDKCDCKKFANQKENEVHK